MKPGKFLHFSPRVAVAGISAIYAIVEKKERGNRIRAAFYINEKLHQQQGGEMPEVITVTEAVRAFGMHPITVSRLIQMQRVRAKKDGNGHWLIQRADLEAWDQQRTRRKTALNQASQQETAA